MTSIAHHGLSGLRAPVPHVDGVMHKAQAVLNTWRQRARSRNELAHMTDMDLHDIGLSRMDVVTEVAKPFWRA